MFEEHIVLLRGLNSLSKNTRKDGWSLPLFSGTLGLNIACSVALHLIPPSLPLNLFVGLAETGQLECSLD